MPSLSEYDEELRTFVESLVRFDTTGGAELAAQEWLRDRLDAFGFETDEWTAEVVAGTARQFLS